MIDTKKLTKYHLFEPQRNIDKKWLKVTTAFFSDSSSMYLFASCGLVLSNEGVEQTRLHPQTPEVQREPFATHSGTM